MEEKMKKMLFLMLFLMILEAANVNSQVRIGGNGQPNTAAVLDLNATDAINNGTKTLALPRVNLTSTTDKLGYTTLLNGMLVYNTTATPGAGVYYWDTSKWVKVSDGTFVESDGEIGNEVTNATLGLGLVRAGAGNVASPYSLGIDTAEGTGLTMRLFHGKTGKFVPFVTSNVVNVNGMGIYANRRTEIRLSDSAWYTTKYHMCIVRPESPALFGGYMFWVNNTGDRLYVHRDTAYPQAGRQFRIDVSCFRVE